MITTLATNKHNLKKHYKFIVKFPKKQRQWNTITKKKWKEIELNLIIPNTLNTPNELFKGVNVAPYVVLPQGLTNVL
jgi:hypothetical protein